MFNCKTLVNLYFVGVYPEDVIALVHVYFMNALLVYVMVKLTEDKRCEEYYFEIWSKVSNKTKPLQFSYKLQGYIKSC